MRHLSIDIETYSSVDIGKSGLYKYAQSPDFEILLFAYAIDAEPVQVVDLANGELIPEDIEAALFDPAVVKHAYNASFEWYCLSWYFGLADRAAWLPQWHCTMLHGLYCGYPAGLGKVGEAIGLPADKQKDSIGKNLIRYFCMPCKPTKTNGGRTRNLPAHEPEKWALFIDYNRQDVVTEMAVASALAAFPVPDWVQTQWVTDQTINLRGVALDMELVSGALDTDQAVKAANMEAARQLTGLDNPGSVPQLSRWLAAETGMEITSLTKAAVAELIDKVPDGKAKRVMQLRQELGKTSTKKYVTMETAACADGRVRGLLQFYGANRTGRWAGRLIQPQNLPRTYIPVEMLPLARELVRGRKSDALEIVYGSVPHTLSQLIRTAFVPGEGCIFVDADFSAIEARVVAWLAGEEWVLDVFRTHGKIYEATASTLYGVPIEKIKKGNPEYALRQKGKAATLALGYGGGAAALITAGQLQKDTPEEELLEIRDKWRAANPHIQRFWWDVEAAAFKVMEIGGEVALRNGTIIIRRECAPATGQDFLTIQIPSGRKLFYAKPHYGTNRFGSTSFCYWGQNQTTKKWTELETYGGKLVENITQAVARDCLAEAIERLEKAGYHIVFHVHDEVVIEVPNGTERDLDRVVAIMSVPPDWAPDLPLNADGWVGDFFRKD